MMDFLSLHYIDLIILILLIITSLIGLNNGFIKEFLNVFIWTLSILFSLLVINKLTISNLINPSIIFSIIFFFILFLLSFISLKLIIHYFIGDAKNIINSNYLNNIFGLLFGFVKGLFLILFSTSVMMYLFYTTKDFPPFFKSSIFLKLLKLIQLKL